MSGLRAWRRSLTNAANKWVWVIDMQLGRVVGHATATVKHPSIAGWRMLVVQPLARYESPDGDPLLVVDSLGAGRGDTVLLTSDGACTRKMLGSDTTPVRWVVLALPDSIATFD